MTDKQLTRIYAVKFSPANDATPKGPSWTKLVRASSQAAALRHVIKPMYEVDVATPDELVELTLKGVKIEEAKAD